MFIDLVFIFTKSIEFKKIKIFIFIFSDIT